MAQNVPPAISGQKYISLITFRKNGQTVPTPVWFGEEGSKLYVMTRRGTGKMKRIHNNPQVRVAPCTIRGKITGPEFAAVVRVLAGKEEVHARRTINRKYWMAWLSMPWRRRNDYLEITFP